MLYPFSHDVRSMNAEQAQTLTMPTTLFTFSPKRRAGRMLSAKC
jgi:hypothetical protein